MPSNKSFKGLNNVSDPLRLGLSWLARADNVDITDTGAIEKRAGYLKTLTGSITSVYSTLDFARCFVVDGGTLKALTGPAAAVSLLANVGTAPMNFTEVNDQVFFSNGVASGIIEADNELLPWRDSPLTDITFLDAAGKPTSALLDPLPLDVGVIQHWRGRIYAAQYFPGTDQTAVWFSQPLGYHLFGLDEDFVLIPGRVSMLAPHDKGLIIGSDKRIHSYDGAALVLLAEYGVVPGQHWSKDDDRILFWTKRGLCAALPFANLTDRQVSVAPGLKAGGALIEQGGRKRYLVSLQRGGSAFNSYI